MFDDPYEELCIDIGVVLPLGENGAQSGSCFMCTDRFCRSPTGEVALDVSEEMELRVFLLRFLLSVVAESSF